MARRIFWINSSAYYGGFKKDIQDFEFGQTMLPLDTADLAVCPAELDHRWRNALGSAMAAKRTNTNAWLKFFNYPVGIAEQQAGWHQNTGYVPITTAAYDLSGKEQGFYETDPGTDTAIKQLSLNEPTTGSKGLRFGNFVQIRDIINEELEAVWTGQKRPLRKRWMLPLLNAATNCCASSRRSQRLRPDA